MTSQSFEDRYYSATYARRLDACETLLASIKDNAGYAERDIERGRIPQLRSILDDALKVARYVEALEQMAEMKQVYDSAGEQRMDRPVKFCPECSHGASLHTSTLNATCTVHDCTCREVFPGGD
jgi:hypothetical protein